MEGKPITTKRPFNYTLIKSFPLSLLLKQKDHRRLKVFFHKGTTCVECGLEGTQLCLGLDCKGGSHLDVYSKDFLPLTVDHIIPKSKGGSSKLENLQPMCSKCNTKKGNGDIIPVSEGERFSVDNFVRLSGTNLPDIGETIYKRTRNKKTIKVGGIVKGIVPNPNFNNAISLQFIEESEKSFFRLKNYYRKKS